MNLHMSNNRKVWQAAALLVDRYGEDAPSVATTQAADMRAGIAKDAVLSAVVWGWIAEATVELLRTKPSIGEQVH